MKSEYQRLNSELLQNQREPSEFKPCPLQLPVADVAMPVLSVDQVDKLCV